MQAAFKVNPLPPTTEREAIAAAFGVTTKQVTTKEVQWPPIVCRTREQADSLAANKLQRQAAATKAKQNAEQLTWLPGCRLEWL